MLTKRFLIPLLESIIVCNQDGEIIMANPLSEKLFGYEVGALIQQKIEILIPSSSRKNHDQHRASYNKVSETRKMGVGRDLTGLKSDGTEFPLEVSLNPAKIGEFMASHEFRALLSTILPSASLISKQSDSSNTGEILKDIK